MAQEVGGIVGDSLTNSAFESCDWADNVIESLLNAVYWTTGTAGEEDYGNGIKGTFDEAGKRVVQVGTNDDGTARYINPQDGAGALIIDRLMSNLSNVESISANAVATEQNISKAMHSKIS